MENSVESSPISPQLQGQENNKASEAKGLDLKLRPSNDEKLNYQDDGMKRNQ